MKYYAVLDTNVLVSALLKNGSVPWRVVEEALHGDIIPILHDDILTEYEDVLNRPKFKFEKRAITVLLNEMKKRGVYAEAGLIEDIVPDPTDVVFYAVLMEKRKEEEAYLVTGNLKHYPVKTYVVTAREMLDILQEAERDESIDDVDATSAEDASENDLGEGVRGSLPIEDASEDETTEILGAIGNLTEEEKQIVRTNRFSKN